MVGFSFFHTTPILAMFCWLSVAVMHLWLVVALCWVRKEKKYDQVIPRPGYWLLIGTSIAIGFLYIPYYWLGGY